VLTFVVGGYLIVLLMISLIENLLVYPTWSIGSGSWSPTDLEFEPVHFPSADGTRLYGWFFEHPEPTISIVFYHGNGEDISRLGHFANELRDRFDASVFVFDYRGYGKSAGRPTERGVIGDGHAAANWLAERSGTSVGQLVHWGRSLGGGVAVDVTSHHGGRALILDRTFTTIPDAAASHFLYGWFPVRWLMRNRFDSLSKIAAYSGPLFQTHGTKDRTVPYALGQRLHQACPSRDKSFLTLPDTDHNDPNPREYHQAITAFLDRIRQPTRQTESTRQTEFSRP
jgi:hypothetical protein